MKKIILLFSVALFIQNFSKAQTLTDSLIAVYKMNGNANDSTLNANNGTLFGTTPSTDRFGVSGGALNFDGIADYIDISPGNSKFKPTTFPISISVWIKFTGTIGVHTGVLLGNDETENTYHGVFMGINNLGQITISYGSGGASGSSSRRTKTSVTVIDNQWHLITGVIRGPTDMDIYVDCKNDGGAYSGTGGAINYDASNGTVSRFDALASGLPQWTYYKGDIDEIRFYHRELKQTDVDRLFKFSNYTFPTVSLGADQTACIGSSYNINPIVSNVNFYLWSNAATTQNINVTTTGNYVVTVSDNHGCKASDTVNLNFVTCGSITTSHTDVSCFGGSNGSATATMINGTPPYSYIWSNLQTTQTISGLIAGTYTCTVTDANVSIVSSAIVVIQPTQISLSETHVNTTCGSLNGSINLSVSGGTPPYNYLWSNTNTTQDLSNISSGTYTVTVHDGNNCVATTSISITNTNGPTLSETHVNTSCGNANGSINLSVSGGAAPFSYTWSNGSTTQDLTNISSGTYTVTVHDGNNCVATTSISITNTNGPTLSETHVNASCGNANGSINLSVSGGAAPISYTWSNGSTTQDLTNISSGTYGVTVVDGNNCVATTSISITNTNGPTLSETHVNASCGNANGSINLSVSGGAAPISYTWSNGSTTQDLTNISSGTYGVTVVDGNNCVATTSISITNTNGPTLSETHVNASCGNANGSINLSVSGGAAPISYTWSNGSTTQDLTNISSGTYTVTVHDGNNCVANISATVGNTSGFTLSEVHVNATCGSSNGSINLTVNGGTAPYTYAWSNGITTEDLNNITEGDYIVVVTDISGCSATATINVICFVSSLCTGFKTFTQGNWGGSPSGNNAALYLHTNFSQAFPNGLTVGGSNCFGSHWLILSTAQAISGFLPSSGSPTKLYQNWINPGSSLHNVLAGQVVAAALNLGFDNWDASFCSNPIHLKDLYYDSGIFSGWTVQQVFNEANRKLSGCFSWFPYSVLTNALVQFNKNYNGGITDLGHLSCTYNHPHCDDDEEDDDDEDRLEGDIDQTLLLSVSPNPVNEKITIAFENGCNCNDEIRITISNMIGQVILYETSYLNSGSINKEIIVQNNLSEGLYFITVRSKNFVKTKSFVVTGK